MEVELFAVFPNALEPVPNAENTLLVGPLVEPAALLFDPNPCCPNTVELLAVLPLPKAPLPEELPLPNEPNVVCPNDEEPLPKALPLELPNALPD